MHGVYTHAWPTLLLIRCMSFFLSSCEEGGFRVFVCVCVCVCACPCCFAEVWQSLTCIRVSACVCLCVCLCVYVCVNVALLKCGTV